MDANEEIFKGTPNQKQFAKIAEAFLKIDWQAFKDEKGWKKLSDYQKLEHLNKIVDWQCAVYNIPSPEIMPKKISLKERISRNPSIGLMWQVIYCENKQLFKKDTIKIYLKNPFDCIDTILHEMTHLVHKYHCKLDMFSELDEKYKLEIKMYGTKHMLYDFDGCEGFADYLFDFKRIPYFLRASEMHAYYNASKNMLSLEPLLKSEGYYK